MSISIERLVYRSDVLPVVEDAVALPALVASWKRRNESLGVTGALAFESGTFVQVLEGDPEILTDLMQSIEGDARHRNVRVLARWPVQAQLFLGRAMVLVETRNLSSHLSKLLSQTGSGAQVSGVLAGLANGPTGNGAPGASAAP